MYKLIVTFFFMATLPCYSQSGEGWHYLKQERGIKIYDQDSAGSIKKFRAEYSIKRSAESIVSFLMDVEDFSWIDGVHHVELLKRNPDSTYLYQFFIRRELAFGAFTVKKDAVASSFIKKRPKFYYLESNIDRGHPESEDYDRLEHYQVKWYIYPDGPNASKVIYEGLVDVEVAFAYPIIKSFISGSMASSFANMRDLLEAETRGVN